MDSSYNNVSGMTPELIRWCSQIDILKHIQLDHFAESFNDGVLFFYLMQELLPEMTEELAILHKKVTRIVAETDFFGKLDNWKLLNSLILEKLMIMRSEWYLGYVARGKDGYIQDLLADMMKVVPEPAGDREKRELLQQNRSSTWDQGQDSFENHFNENDEAMVSVDDNDENGNLQQEEQPSFSFYHTPLSDEDEENQDGQQGGGSGHGRRRVSRFSNSFSEDRGVNKRWGSGSQQYHQRRGPLRRIQRNGGKKYINKSRTDFRHFQNNQHQPQHGNHNSYGMNQRTEGKRERFLIPTGPRDYTRGRQAWKPRQPQPYYQQPSYNQYHQPYHHQQQWNQGGQQHRQGPQLNQQDYLNQRFNEMQNNAGLYTRSRRSPFAKYFYKYYLQFVPVSCNNCIDNNLQCNCPRFGFNQDPQNSAYQNW